MKLNKYVGAVLGWLVLFPLPVLGEELRDIKPPVEYPMDKGVLIISSLAVLGAIVAVVYYFIKRKKIIKKAVKVLTPWEKAYWELDQLRKNKLSIDLSYEAYYVKLSDIIRSYIEARFNIKASEMTTEEFLRFYKDTNLFTEAQKILLKEFLQLSDLVKFAQYTPEEQAAKKHFDMAKLIVDQTRVPEGEINV